MKSNLKILALFIFVLFAMPMTAHAHLIGGNGLESGITHPFFGLDHLLAMVAVGIISTQIGGKAIWKVPTVFVSFMVVGGLFGIEGFQFPIAETGITVSVLVFGVFIVLSKKIPVNWAMICVALFALFHGHSHGEEMPLIANAALYTIGFVFSTTLLHIMGVLIGHYARKTEFTLELLRYLGAGMSGIGLLFLFGF
ncbi:HupE/UreJ family protein [Candidatus Peregrinibacteria bacterium]|nr:HupE/UreJ family protein [Candidatus Peregrinibacteria bacterium]